MIFLKALKGAELSTDNLDRFAFTVKIGKHKACGLDKVLLMFSEMPISYYFLINDNG